MPRRLFERSTLLLALALVLCLAPGSRGDTLILKDGRRIEGTVTSREGGQVTVKTSFGEMTIDEDDILEIKKGKTKRQEYQERFEAAESAQDFFELGEWAASKRLRKETEKAYLRAVELDPEHADAHRALGHVRYKGVWMTPEERDAKSAEDRVAEMRAQGLVQYKGQWVTPEEKVHLAKGEVLVDGVWMDPEAAKLAQGFLRHGGEWVHGSVVRALEDEEAVEEVVKLSLRSFHNDRVHVVGPYDLAYLEELAGDLDRGALWFETQFGVTVDPEFLGGRLAEIFVFDRNNLPYQDSVGHFVAKTHTLPEAAVPSMQKIHGFYFFDPYSLSSVRVGHRDRTHLSGHCLHHFGHLMANRQGYDGRLLPPWYDEGMAALVEYSVYGKNHVFCRAEAVRQEGDGSKAKGTSREFDTVAFRNGAWGGIMEEALKQNRVQRFDRLAGKDLGELELIDIATSIMILSWIVEEGDEHAMARFQAEIRKDQPAAPVRVLRDAKQRNEIYDRAFGAAVQMTWRQADQAWRTWVLDQ